MTGPGPEERIQKLEATLRGMEEDGYPAEALAGLKAQISDLKGEVAPQNAPTGDADAPPDPSNFVVPWTPEAEPPSAPSTFVRPWTPDDELPVAPPAAPPTTAPLTKMNLLRSKSEEGYKPAARKPAADPASGGTFVDKLRARINRWTPEQAAADAQRRAEDREAQAQAEIEWAAAEAARLDREQATRETTFATEALTGALRRATDSLRTNTDDLYKWSGKTRRKLIQDTTDERLADVRGKLEAAEAAGAALDVLEQAAAVINQLEAAKVSREKAAGE